MENDVELNDMKLSNSTKEPVTNKLCGKRILLAFLIWFGLMLTFGGKFNFFTALAFHHMHPALEKLEKIEHDDFDAITDLGLQSIFAFYCGYVLTSIPGGYLSYRFHATKVYFLSVVLSCFITVFLPVVIDSKEAIISLHFLQGLAEGMLIPAFFGIWRHWAPVKERNLLIPISYSGLFLGLLAGSGISMEFRHQWAIPCYIFGGLTILWLICWLWFVHESPAVHPSISEREMMAFSNLPIKPMRPISWLQMLTSFPVAAIFMANLCYHLNFEYLIHTEYINHAMIAEMMLFPSNSTDPAVQDNHIRSEFLLEFFIPYTLCAVMIFLAALLAFYLHSRRNIRIVRIRKGFTCFGFAVSFIIWLLNIGLMGMNIFMAIFFGFPIIGFFLNALDISPQQVSIVVGLSNTFAVFFGVLVPLLVELCTNLVPYANIVISSIMMFVTCIFYSIFASEDIQPWEE